MQRTSLARDGWMLAAAAAIGWWAHGDGRHVQAAEANMVYQFNTLTSDSSLTIYNAEERTLYVYQGVTVGNSHLSCSYRYRIPRPGAPIDRENCAAGSLLR